VRKCRKAIFDLLKNPTAEELCTVARVLSVADPDKDVNLGAKTMEARAKALSASGTLTRADRPRRGSGSRRDRDVRRQSREPAPALLLERRTTLAKLNLKPDELSLLGIPSGS
jgi:hypothetical protein